MRARFTRVGRELVEEALQVGTVGVASFSEALDAEREWIIGTHGAQCDVGPVVREGVVDLGGALDTPSVGAVPREPCRDGGLGARDICLRVIPLFLGAGEASVRLRESCLGASSCQRRRVSSG